MKYVWYYESPIGRLGIAETDGAIAYLLFDEVRQVSNHVPKETALIKETAKQVWEYFDGKRKNFDLPLNPQGTVFQKAVWSALQEIPFGETCSYKQIAEQIGNPKAVRAVGMANNRNPIAVIIPCHRVIGMDGGLTGYAGGLAVKQYLLNLEKNNV